MINIMALPLNLNLIEVLIHLVNLIILILAIKIFLYKPIKKFMNKRAEEFQVKTNQTEELYQQNIETKKQYDDLMANARQEAMQIKEDALKEAKLRSDDIVKEAKKKANELLIVAQKEMEQKNKEEMERLKTSISDIACNVAQDILKREVNQDDIDNQINTIVREWK